MNNADFFKPDNSVVTLFDHYMNFTCDDEQVESWLTAFVQQGFVVIDGLYRADFLQQLAVEYQQHQPLFREAAIQNGINAGIRRDHILWIEAHLSAATLHLRWLGWLGQQFNRALFLGLKNIEAHYACYEAGDFYGLHRDNPQQKNGRVVSSVFYHHLDWQADWGGELRLQDSRQQWHELLPLPNRLVVFQSDLLHEVKLTQASRHSITAWLRCDGAIF